MPRRTKSRKSRRVRRARKPTGRRLAVSRFKGRLPDTHTFGETINAGTLLATGSQTASTGAFIMRLVDFPAYQALGPNFEFARLEECEISFWPKANMQIATYTVAGAVSNISVSGTLITAIDQVPVYSIGNNQYANATNWAPDSSNDTGVTSCTAVSTLMTTSYIRGLQGSKETELYKKQTRRFFPAFYDYVMTGVSTSGALNSANNPIPADFAADNFGTNGCVERKIKKWVSITNVTSGSSGQSLATNTGPLYFGPIYALDVNSATNNGDPLFDVRLRYKLSFKRLRGV